MPNFDNCGCKMCNNPCCLNTVLSIIAALFFTALGLILGAVYYETIVPVLSAVITAAVVFFVMFVVFLIIRNCNR